MYEGDACSLYCPALLAGRKVSPAVPLPASLVRLRTRRTFLAIADRLEPVGGYARLYEEVACGRRAPVAQAQVVLGRTALVAVALHVDGGAREVGEDAFHRLGVATERRARVVADVVRIVVEE